MKKILLTFFVLCSLESAAQNALVFMSYNVRNGHGIDENLDYNRAAEVIRICSPDIVALQELDSVTNRNNHIDASRELGRLTKMNSYYSKAIDFQGGGYGIGLLCKDNPLNLNRLTLPGAEEQRTLLIAEFEKFIFCSTHLSLTDSDQMSSIAIFDSIAQNSRKPIFIGGDFNFTPDSKQFEELSKTFTILTDISKSTYPADKPDCCIDYIIFGKNSTFAVEVQKSEVVEAPSQSDHRPVLIRIILKNK